MRRGHKILQEGRKTAIQLVGQYTGNDELNLRGRVVYAAVIKTSRYEALDHQLQWVGMDWHSIVLFIATSNM